MAVHREKGRTFLFLVKTRIYVYETLCPNRCESSMEFQGGGGDQGRCERRSEVFVKIKKIYIFFFFGGGGGGVESGRGGGGGGHGRCEQRSEVFVKIQKKKYFLGGGWVGGGGGVRMYKNEELKFL